MTTALTQNNLLRREQGMTTAELVIVLAITGALSVFMGTELQAMADQVYLNTAVAGVGGDFPYGRSRAKSEGQTIRCATVPHPPGTTASRANDVTQPVARVRRLMELGL